MPETALRAIEVDAILCPMKFPLFMLLPALTAAAAPVAQQPPETEAAILARIQAPVFAQRDFSIVDYGATPGRECTDALTKAIAACHGAGGGRVVVPAG